MAVQSGIKIDGMDELKEVLDLLAPRVANNLMRATVHGIASTIAKDAKARAPKDSGDLRKAIKAKQRKAKAPNKPVSDVMVEHGDGARYDAYYWRFVEYGTQTQPERPFLRPAIDLARANMPEVMREQFGKKVEQALKRAAKKAAKA